MALASFHKLPTKVMVIIRGMSSPLTRVLLALTCKTELAFHPLLVPKFWIGGRPYYQSGMAPKAWWRALVREAISLNNGVILRALLPTWCTNHWILERAVATGCLDALEPLFDAGRFMGKKLVAHYIERGNTAVLEVIIDAWKRRGSPSGRDAIWDESTFHRVIPDFRYYAQRWTDPVFARQPNATFAMEHGCPVSSYFVNFAIRKNDHAFLRLAHKNGYNWRPRELHEAIKGGNMMTTALLLSMGCPLDQHSLGIAFKHPLDRYAHGPDAGAPMARLLLDHNCLFDEAYMRRVHGGPHIAGANHKIDRVIDLLRLLSLVK